MKAVLVGYGEVGRGIKDALCLYHDIITYDPMMDIYDADHVDECDVLLVAIPYSDGFVKIVKDYKLKFNPDAVIVFSTVPVGTCRQIGIDTAHSPIEGRHPDLGESFEVFTRFVGGGNLVAFRFLRDAGFEIERLAIPEHTEFMKMYSTTLYGLLIEYARYANDVCEKLHLPYYRLNDYNRAYNFLYADHFDMPEFTRAILEPPVGRKGGHCVTPNARMLYEQYPNPLVREVAELDFDADR